MSTLTLRIEKPVYGGAGLARADGKVVFVPYTLPGELVEAAPSTAKKSFTEAALHTILEPAATRVEPPCPYFGRCGGCHYQHADYAAQVEMKLAILRESLERAGLSDPPPITPEVSAPLGYRNRVRLHIDPASSALCYKERNSHRNLPVAICPIASPTLQHAFATFSHIAEADRLGRHFREVELFENQDGSELLLSLHALDQPPSLDLKLRSIAETMRQTVPTLRGAAANAQPSPLSAHQGRRRPSNPEEHSSKPVATWGAPALTYGAAGEQYRVPSGSFFQANRLLVDALARLATESGPGNTAWDLYAGVGLFSKLIAQRFEFITAVEGAPASSAALLANLGKAARVVRSSVLDFLRRPHAARPDLILLDPPRAGLGSEITTLLSRIGAPRITYVSCDPATLSRDLAALVHSGYHIQTLHMVDMFPQTYHLETVAQLTLA